MSNTTLHPSGSLHSLVGLTACALMPDNIGDDSMDAPFEEWLAGKWQGKTAHQLRVGDIMRDTEGGGVKVTGIYPSEDCYYVTGEGNRTCQIPRAALVLVKPNDQAHRQTGGANQ